MVDRGTPSASWRAPSHVRAFTGAWASSVLASTAHFLVLTGLVELAGAPPVGANAAAAVVGGGLNFAINKYAVFDAKHGDGWQQAGRYAIVSATNLALVTLLLHAGTSGLGVDYRIVWAISSTVVMAAWAYPANRAFIFSAGTTPPAVPHSAATAIATVFGVGRTPRAPGTAGSLAALPLIWAIGGQPAWLQVAVAAAVAGIGMAAADAAGRSWGDPDDRRIVVDEVAGMLVAFVAAPVGLGTLAVGFVAFRLADTWKPWPARWVDRTWKTGVGCVLDDLVAGGWACLVVQLWAYAVTQR